MSLSANFLKDAKVGTLVEIIVGPKEIQGTIISITEDVIKILTKDGKTKNLSLSGITYYEILDVYIFFIPLFWPNLKNLLV